MICMDDCCHEPLPDLLVLNRRQVKRSRKQHTCTYCAGVIEPGSRCSSVTYLTEGKVYTDYNHYPLHCAGGEWSL